MAVAFALLTSLAYGVANFIGPRLARSTSLFVLLLVGQSCSAVLAALVVVAQADPVPAGDEVAFALLAGLGNAGGLILFYRAAAVGPLSIITPIGAFGVAVPVTAGLASGETLALGDAAGIVLALTGLVLVSRRPTGPPAHDHHDIGRAVALAVGSALFFGVFLAAMAPASDGGAGWAVLISRLSLLAALLAVTIQQGELRRPDVALPLLAVPGVLLFVGTLSYSLATREGDLSVVSVLGSLFTPVTVGLAMLIDRERLTRAQAAGVLAAIAGVVLLSAR